MAINYVPSTPELGIQPIGQVAVTTKQHPLGTIVKAYDATNGEGEFVYAPGVANNIVGALVTWNPVAKTTTLVTNTTKLGWPVAVSMAANTSASSYSWYQIAGVAQIKKTATVAAIATKLAISATTGAVLAGSTVGKMIEGALTVNSTVSANTYTLALINRPHMQVVAT